jgi:hypothetical protein
VDVAALKQISGSDSTKDETKVKACASSMTSTTPESTANSSEVAVAIERLSDLNKKGILTDAEFKAKKAKLLARL